jgi:hypothetical protein
MGDIPTPIIGQFFVNSVHWYGTIVIFKVFPHFALFARLELGRRVLCACSSAVIPRIQLGARHPGAQQFPSKKSNVLALWPKPTPELPC